MINPPEFDTYREMQTSQWLADLKNTMEIDSWPVECVRCQETEQVDNNSLRLNELKKHPVHALKNSNYIIVSGVLDNICNSACQSCTSVLSTKIGSLVDSKNYITVNNQSVLDTIPRDQIIQLDITGGEPSASPNYKKLLDNLPKNLQYIRINTNGSLYIKKIEELLEQGIQVVVTLSFDGIGSVHDYVRWPIVWEKYLEQVQKYKELADRYSKMSVNFWSTLHALNIGNFPEMLQYSEFIGIPLSYGILHQPEELSIRYANRFTKTAKNLLKRSEITSLNNLSTVIATDKDNSVELEEFISRQDQLRNIRYQDFFGKQC